MRDFRAANRHLIPRTMQQAVVEDLRDAILRGRLLAGARLNQNMIASRYGVSPIPIREALRQLESEGLVRSTPHRGAIVASLSRDEIRDLYDMRIALESLAIQLGVRQAKSKDIAKLESLLSRMDAERDPVRWLDLNLEFHRALYAPANRSHLCKLIDTLRRNTERYLRIYVRSMGRIQAAQREHRRILQAYRDGDANTAVAALREHLEHTLSRLLTLLSESSVLRTNSSKESIEATQRRRGHGATVDE